MLSPNFSLALAAVGLTVLSSGCARDNGLPDDLTEHLAGYGISVLVLGSEAPLSSRSGHVFFAAAPGVEQEIIAALGLEPIEPGSPEFELVCARVSATPRALFGTSGRPPGLQLEDGGQFEFLYLLQTTDGRTYLLAEYAYG
jgi:hypothetical protein